MLTPLEAAELFIAADREPQFEEFDAAPYQHTLQLRCLAHEFQVIAGLAEAHDTLDTGTVVPGTVK